MRKLALGKLKVDWSLYPRPEGLDPQHLRYMREAYEAGATFPALVIDKRSKRIVDGMHRYKMLLKAHDEKHEVEVIEKTYANDQVMFVDAARLNADHGRTLTKHDRVHCILKATELGIEVEEIAAALHMTVEAAGELRVERVGELRLAKGTSEAVPLKRTIQHMAGKRLTKRQVEVNHKLSGMNATFHAVQLIMLLETNLIDTTDQRLLEKLAGLRKLLGNFGALPDVKTA